MSADPVGQFVLNKAIMVGGVARKYALPCRPRTIRQKPYRTIFSFHGCGAHDDNLINIQTRPGSMPSSLRRSRCRATATTINPTMSKDLPVFDAIVQWAEDNLLRRPIADLFDRFQQAARG